MRKTITLALAAAVSIVSFAAPAAADIVIVDASSIQGANVLFNDGTQTGPMVSGLTMNGLIAVNFTGTTTRSDIISANGGQARVEGEGNTLTPQPNDTLGLTSLFINLADGTTFNNLEFNLFGSTDGATANFSLTDDGGQVFTFDSLLGNGSNFFGFQGINGQSISSASITIAGGSIQDVRQIRLDAVGAVPEPGTWAMMLIGFGAAGVAIRRRKRLAVQPMQIA